MPNQYPPGTIIELEFDRKPTNEELRRTVGENGLSCYRFIRSADLVYQVQAIDLYAELQRTTTPATDEAWIVPATITCRSCKAQFKGWIVQAKKWYDNKPYYHGTEYCPLCPPVSTDIWLAGMGIQKDRPADFNQPPVKRIPQPDTTMSVDMEDFD